MNTHQEQKQAIRQYLLGQLPEEELLQLEERLFAEDSLYEELQIQEEELVDQYLEGQLSVQESQGFETHFLRPPGRQQKLRFAGALKKYVASEVANRSPEEPTLVRLTEDYVDEPAHPLDRRRLFSWLHIQSPVAGFALAAALLVIVFGAAWVAIKNRSQPTPHDILTEVLIPGLTRDDQSEVRRFSIPTGKDTVRLQLDLIADEYPAYRAVLQDALGTVVLQKDNLKAQPAGRRSAVILDVAAGQLPASYYLIKLKGITASGNEENAGSYHFIVSR